MFKKTIVVLAAASILSACSTLNTLTGRAAGLNDEALKSSEFTICKGASVGSVLRRYNTKELAEAWVKLCLDSNTAPVVTEVVENE